MITAPEPALMLVMVKSNYCVFMNQSVAFDFVLSKPMYWNIDKMKVCCVNMIRIKIECVTCIHVQCKYIKMDLALLKYSTE